MPYPGMGVAQRQAGAGRWRLENEMTMESLQSRVEKIGPPWKVGNEFLPYHPSASHVSPEHRDGWNYCYLAAMRSSQNKLEPDGSVWGSFICPLCGAEGTTLHRPNA